MLIVDSTFDVLRFTNPNISLTIKYSGNPQSDHIYSLWFNHKGYNIYYTDNPLYFLLHNTLNDTCFLGRYSYPVESLPQIDEIIDILETGISEGVI